MLTAWSLAPQKTNQKPDHDARDGGMSYAELAAGTELLLPNYGLGSLNKSPITFNL